jgi:hypothetical protein
MHDLWGIKFSSQLGQEGLCPLSVSVPLKQDIEHETVLIYSPSYPMSDAINARAQLVQMPPKTPQRRGAGFEKPFADGVVTDLDTAPVQQFLNTSVA